MKTTDFAKLPQFVKAEATYKVRIGVSIPKNITSPALIPINRNAYNLLDQKEEGELFYLEECAKRDVAFHRCYFSLLSYIYAYLPKVFRDAVPENHFYKWLQHLKGEYKVLFTFNDGTKFVEYNSISFGRMNQTKFEEYIRDQLPFIYEDVIRPCYKDELKKYDAIIENIEDEYKKFLSKI